MVGVILQRDLARVESLGHPFLLWSVHMTERQGAFVDWPTWPLVLVKDSSGFIVNAEVGQAGDYDLDDGELTNCIDVPLGSTELVYREADERAWLREPEGANLASACKRVAALAPRVSRALTAEQRFDATHISFDELQRCGPWL